MLEFNLPTNDIPLSTIFAVLQRAQQSLSLQDYSVSQTTLDQVFVSFASQQVNDDEPSSYEVPKTKNMQLNKKCAEKQFSTTTGGNTTRIGTGLSSTLTANIHETKVSLKRHASQLMSLCRERRKTKKRTAVAKAANQNHQHHDQPTELSAHQLQPKVSSQQLHQQHLKNNLIFSNKPSFQKPLKQQANVPSITRVNSHVSSLANQQKMAPYLAADRFWTISGYGGASGGQYQFQAQQQHQKKHLMNFSSGLQRGVPVVHSGKVNKAKRSQAPPLTGHHYAASRYAGQQVLASTLPPNAGLGSNLGNPYAGGVNSRRASVAPPIVSATLMMPENYEFSRHHKSVAHHQPSAHQSSTRFLHPQQHHHTHHNQQHALPVASKSSTMPGHRLPPNAVHSQQNSKHRSS